MTNLLHFYKYLKTFSKRFLIGVIGVTMFLVLFLVNYDDENSSNNYLLQEVTGSISTSELLPKNVLTLQESPENIKKLPDLVPVISKKWISMALCWGNRMDLYHKSQFPYALAGLLSTKLWQKFVKISVIFHIVVCDQAQIYDDYKLKDYIQDLEKTGALVQLFYVENCDKCVLTAQLVRLLAYLSKEVRSSDLIIMADVDTFPMTKNIFEPIEKTPEKSIWVLKYDTSVKHNVTFSMHFMAMQSQTWKQIFHNPQSTTELLENFNDKLKLNQQLDKNQLTWNFDQSILTRAILESRLCSFPKNNSLWSLLQMKPIEMVKDSDQNTCFHGKLEDCNRDHPKANGGNCQYWHFFPEERRKELMEKYKEIIGEKSPDSKIIHKFKDVRFEMEKILGLRN